MALGNIKSYVLPCAALLVLCVLLFSGKTQAQTEEQAAGDIVAACADAGGDHAQCYEELVPKLYPHRPVAELFTVIRKIRQLDPPYQFCHVLAHKLGERVVAEDLAHWIEAIALNPPDGLCSNGFIHGVVGGRFRAEVLTEAAITELLPDFRRACMPRKDWAPSDLDRAICYHGMGHLFDFITNADIPHALAICAQVTPPGYERVCVEGVFMQIYQPLEPDDYALIEQMQTKPSTTTVRNFCASYSSDPEVEGACLRESWPYFSKEIQDGTGVAAFCSGQPDAEHADICYESVSSLVGRMSLGEPEKTIMACSNFPPERRATCYSYNAEAVLQEDRSEAGKSVGICTKAGGSLAAQCIEHLISHAEFIFGENNEQFKAFCHALPADQAQACMQQYSARESAQ